MVGAILPEEIHESRFMKSMTLSEIWIYPIKSMGGVSLRSARILPKGLDLDRRWMLVDEKGAFLTQRSYPQMALFKVSLAGDHIQVAYRNDTLSIPINPKPGTSTRTKIWKDEISVVQTAPGFDNWFSARIGVACRLVAFPEENPRTVERGHRSPEDHARLQDAFPFLIIGQGSMDELNRRLETPVGINRFRPNLVFTGGDPHEEDTWRDFTIGGLPFLATRTCGRCSIPGVDQHTGRKGKEPLATLARYRQVGTTIMFGMNAVGPGTGEINIGDAVKVGVAENIL